MDQEEILRCPTSVSFDSSGINLRSLLWSNADVDQEVERLSFFWMRALVSAFVFIIFLLIADTCSHPLDGQKLFKSPSKEKKERVSGGLIALQSAAAWLTAHRIHHQDECNLLRVLLLPTRLKERKKTHVWSHVWTFSFSFICRVEEGEDPTRRFPFLFDRWCDHLKRKETINCVSECERDGPAFSWLLRVAIKNAHAHIIN